MDRNLIASEELERYIISMCINRNELTSIAISRILPEHFFYEQYRIMYQCIVEAFNDLGSFDILVIVQRSRRHTANITANIAYEVTRAMSLTEELIGINPHGDKVKVFEEACNSLLNYHGMRLVRKYNSDTSLALNDAVGNVKDVVTSMRKFIAQLEQTSTDDEPTTISAGVEELLKVSESPELRSSSVCMTGYKKIDDAFGGFKGGELIVVAGRPGMGKTAFGIGAMYNITKAGIPVLYITYEMKESELVNRIIMYHFDVTDSDLRKGLLSERLQAELRQSTAFRSQPAYMRKVSDMDDEKLSQMVRHYVVKYNIRMVMVDYLQLIKNRKGTQGEEAVALKSRSLKTIAMDNDVPVIAFAQLSRSVESRDLKRPRLEDLKGSGAIEADADAVLLAYRPGYYNIDQIGGENVSNKIKMIAAKFRDGKPRDITLIWNEGRILDESDAYPF